MAINDDVRTGRPTTSRTDLNVAQVEGLILENRRVIVRDKSAVLDLFIGIVHRNVHEELGEKQPLCNRIFELSPRWGELVSVLEDYVEKK